MSSNARGARVFLNYFFVNKAEEFVFNEDIRIRKISEERARFRSLAVGILNHYLWFITLLSSPLEENRQGL